MKALPAIQWPDNSMCSDADHAGYRVKSFAASADCRLAVIVLFDSTVAVWDMGSMECICMLQSWGDRDAARVHSAGVNAAYLTPSGSRAVTVSGDHTARVWDVSTAECKFVLTGMLHACWLEHVRSCIDCADICNQDSKHNQDTSLLYCAAWHEVKQIQPTANDRNFPCVPSF